MTSYYGPQDGFGPPPPAQPALAYPAPGYPAPARQLPVLGVVSLIISSLALLGVVALVLVVLFSLFGTAMDDEDEDYYATGGGTVTGQLDARPTGIVIGTDLVTELTATLTASGSEVQQLQCPDTPAIKQGVVTVCHGTVDYEPWALTVFFEDAGGAYTVDFV